MVIRWWVGDQLREISKRRLFRAEALLEESRETLRGEGRRFRNRHVSRLIVRMSPRTGEGKNERCWNYALANGGGFSAVVHKWKLVSDFAVLSHEPAEHRS
jgi:hypothetical protein